MLLAPGTRWRRGRLDPESRARRHARVDFQPPPTVRRVREWTVATAAHVLPGRRDHRTAVAAAERPRQDAGRSLPPARRRPHAWVADVRNDRLHRTGRGFVAGFGAQ